MIQQSIVRLVDGHELSTAEVEGSLEEIISGKATQAQVAGFLVALKGKGETADELAAFATTFRRHGLQIRPVLHGRLVDTCGTGGDGAGTFNISTVSAIVASGAGVYIAKHGNRSVTGKSGSADLLEGLGFNLSMEPGRVKESIEQIGIGFMFAPTFHPAMKQVGAVRRELGIRTIFNLMGPLMNPAGADSQLLGVYSTSLSSKVAQALQKLGTREAMVVHALEGMDEISVSGETLVSWLRDGQITTRGYSPGDFSMVRSSGVDLRISSVEESAKVALDILGGDEKAPGKVDLVVVNAAAAIVLAGLAGSFAEAVPLARRSLESGAAQKKLEGLIRMSGGSMERMENHAAAQ
ncbi:MAG: anthranilate phosphoribosyltransferase [Thaumarchaeota archaeon]|nr:anthranilate phosphoribosyltransferase [Nitrososphaerota archaeon]